MRSHADTTHWDDVLAELQAPHVLQGELWGTFKSRWGWRVHRFSWSEGEHVMAAAQVLSRKPARLPVRVGYVPKGPLLRDPNNPAVWRRVLGDLTRWSRSAGLTMLKIDPDVPSSSTDVTAAWSDDGWRPSSAPVQFPNTMTTDLGAGEAGLLAGMHGKTRYNIRLAERRGVSVRRGGRQDLEAFYRLYADTGARTGFGVRDMRYYLDVWSHLLAANNAVVLLAERQSVPLAGAIPVLFGSTAWYLYGASANEGREHMPAYAAQWESMRWALERGCDRYDWWGGPTVLDASDPMWGVYRFKRGFGAVWVEQVGAWDQPVQRLRYGLFERLERWRRRRIAARTKGR